MAVLFIFYYFLHKTQHFNLFFRWLTNTRISYKLKYDTHKQLFFFVAIFLPPPPTLIIPFVSWVLIFNAFLVYIYSVTVYLLCTLVNFMGQKVNIELIFGISLFNMCPNGDVHFSIFFVLIIFYFYYCT